MKFSISPSLLLAVVSFFSSNALAGSHNYLSIYSDGVCQTSAGEASLFEDGQCLTLSANSVETILVYGDCNTYILGYRAPGCTGKFEIVSNTNDTVCVEAQNGQWRSFSLTTTC